MACEYKEPVRGWRDDDLKIMGCQIKLVSSNGIDFFSFCWYWKSDNGRIYTLKITNHLAHTSIELSNKVGNNHKMRFLLLIETHVGARIKTGKDWLNTVFF